MKNSSRNTFSFRQVHILQKLWLHPNSLKDYLLLEKQMALEFFNHGLRTPKEEIAFTVRPKINPNPKFLGTAEAYFVCHIGPIFQISLIYVRSPCLQQFRNNYRLPLPSLHIHTALEFFKNARRIPIRISFRKTC